MGHMDTNMSTWADKFPTLFTESHVDYADCTIRYTTDPFPEELVSRLHVVALTEDGDVVVCRTEQGWRFLPGGTREPGESLVDLARRELVEEAGVEMVGDMRLFSAHVADSNLPHPYRSHQPHPRAYWAYAVAKVRVVGEPSNPADAEQVVEVLTLPVQEAADYIEVHDLLMADVLRHAVAADLLS